MLNIDFQGLVFMVLINKSCSVIKKKLGSFRELGRTDFIQKESLNIYIYKKKKN